MIGHEQGGEPELIPARGVSCGDASLFVLIYLLWVPQTYFASGWLSPRCDLWTVPAPPAWGGGLEALAPCFLKLTSLVLGW